MTVRQSIDVRVHGIRCEAENIFAFDLRPVEGGGLPPFTAGAHIEILMKEGLERSYSLVNAPGVIDRYEVVVARDPQGRGGSEFMCAVVRPGDQLRITPPSNNFALEESAEATVLIAGGIGITPIWSMLQRLQDLGRPWKLFYTARTSKRAAFRSELEALRQQFPDNLRIVFDQEPNAVGLDIKAIVEEGPANAHYYACGPAGLLHAFEQATAGLDPALVHIERFSSDQAPARGGFEITLAKSQRSFTIPPDKTILEVLLDEGIEVNRSCMEGVCGTCETAVLEGIPDHRDQVLSKRERAANRMMMICCSGSKTDRLVLDL
jgi:ferredoxin-NADP reductase